MLIDFASTTQTWELDKLNHIANYYGILQILLGREGNGFNTELVWKHYGEPDDWDPLLLFRVGRPWDKYRVVTARDMFPYISSVGLDAIYQNFTYVHWFGCNLQDKA